MASTRARSSYSRGNVARNSWLSKRQAEVLAAMRADRDGPAGDDHFYGYLTVDAGEAWYGHERTSVALVNSLLRLCVISVAEESGEPGGRNYTVHYRINEDGEKCLDDPAYEPRIIAELRKDLEPRA